MKVALKSNSFTSEEAFLIKSLKFFDIYNTGELDFNNFFRSIEKIGVIIEKETLQYIFDNFYDQAHTGKLNIKNWSKNVVSQIVPDVVAKSPHAFSPIKAGAAYPDEVRPLQRSGLPSAGFPLATTQQYYQPTTYAGRTSVTNEQFFSESAR